MNTVNKLLFVMLFSILGVVSCDDHDIEEPSLNNVIVKDLVLSSRIGHDLFFDINRSKNRNKSMVFDDCLEVKHEWSEDSEGVTIRIKYNNCVKGGITKNGEIRVHVNSQLTMSAMMTKIEFVNLTVNGNAIDGKMIIKSLTTSNFETDLDLKLKYADGSSISWKGTQKIQILSDGTWEINGTEEGKARNGKYFKRTGIKLIKNSECPWYVGGKMEIVVDKDEKYDVEFTSKCGDVYYTYKGVRAKLKLD